VLGIAVATVLRYVGYKLWVFTGDAAPTALPADEPAEASTTR